MAPEKVLITGGREVGGVASFAEALSSGFSELGVPSEIIRPVSLSSRLGDLRSKRILKLLSTSGMLAVPLARRAFCVSHTVPMAKEHGWRKAMVLASCYKVANACSSARVVAVSDYVALHLAYLFNVRVDGTVRNPLPRLFFEPFEVSDNERIYVTFVGRLVKCKRLELLLPAICDLLEENAHLRCCIVGDGPLRGELEKSIAGNDRVEVVGSRDYTFVRERLRRSKIFVSGAGNEGMGIAYLEALSQGCIVAMPATGGGVEVALQRIGQNVQLLPISLERGEVLKVLRNALQVRPSPVCLQNYAAKAVASAYLDLDRTLFCELTH
jgi:glycosyltransferase involved in cell wall biosynthesis